MAVLRLAENTDSKRVLFGVETLLDVLSSLGDQCLMICEVHWFPMPPPLLASPSFLPPSIHLRYSTVGSRLLETIQPIHVSNVEISMENYQKIEKVGEGTDAF
jgi:hypothetical protein